MPLADLKCNKAISKYFQVPYFSLFKYPLAYTYHNNSFFKESIFSFFSSWDLIACFHWAVQFGSVQNSTQLCLFPLSEAVHGTKIANRTIPLIWYPSVGVPSTVVRYIKVGARFNAERSLVDRESSLARRPVASYEITEVQTSVHFSCQNITFVSELLICCLKLLIWISAWHV